VRDRVRNREIVKRRARPAAKRARPAAKRAPAAAKRVRPAAKGLRPAEDRLLRHVEAEISARRKALTDLMHSQVLGQGDICQAFNQITETAVSVLGVERASVWRLVDGGDAIECIDLYERTQQRHSKGLRISAHDVPRYFEALQRERAIRAHDARTDTRTSELRDDYLAPLGITSMLDAPVFLRGKMVGVVCHEHTGRARRWKLHEELLAGSFADFVALVLETAAWHEAQDALRLERDALEGKVADRTRDLKESEANLRALVDFSPIAMVVTRIADSNVLLANRRAAAMFDVPLDAIQGRNAPQHWVNLAERARYLEHVFRHGRVDDFEAEMRTAHGRTFWAHLSGQRLRFAGDDALLAAIVDVTEQRRTQQDLRQQATHDALTGVFNRRHVVEVLHKELERAQRHERPLAVAMMDADHFKRINDTHGHQTGDEVLRAISDRCQKTLRANDVLGRYGGEEFVIVFPETSLEDATVVAERLRVAVAASPIQVGDKALDVTVSIGVAAFASGHDMDKLFHNADLALYTAKQDGRNLVRA
jgi:diguanylate cyclase (GGDEF)-like protein/PAS domain S-box-containing protein